MHLLPLPAQLGERMCLPAPQRPEAVSAMPTTTLITANCLEMDMTATKTFSVLFTDSAGEPVVWFPSSCWCHLPLLRITMGTTKLPGRQGLGLPHSSLSFWGGFELLREKTGAGTSADPEGDTVNDKINIDNNSPAFFIGLFTFQDDCLDSLIFTNQISLSLITQLLLRGKLILFVK